jgi:hypothetical protein
MWTAYDPHRSWAFRTSPPYTIVHASPAVVAGTAAIDTVLRDVDGTWWFLDAGADPGSTEQVKLRHLATTHPDTATIADLRPGERADRNPDGSWNRPPVTP